MKTTFIYTLSDPISGEIRYIGKANNPKKRVLDHIKEGKTINKSHKISWVKSLLNKGLFPIVEILDEVPISEWEFWEQYWISQFKAWNFNLTNISPGGYNNNYKRSIRTKKKMRKSKLGCKLSEEHKHNISNSVTIKAKESPNYNKCYDKIHIMDKDILYEKYIIENLSMPKLSKLFSVSEKTIFTNLKEYGIKKDKEIWKKQCISNPEKTVLQYNIVGEFIKEWIGLKSITKELKINSSNIANCCRGKVKSAGGFIWKYKDNI